MILLLPDISAIMRGFYLAVILVDCFIFWHKIAEKASPILLCQTSVVAKLIFARVLAMSLALLVIILMIFPTISQTLDAPRYCTAKSNESLWLGDFMGLTYYPIYCKSKQSSDNNDKQYFIGFSGANIFHDLFNVSIGKYSL